MSFQHTTNADVNVDRPYDSRHLKATITDRDAIPEDFRHLGLKCYVEDVEKEYVLVGGVTNSHWVYSPVQANENIETLLAQVSNCSKVKACDDGSLLTHILIYNATAGTSPLLDIGTTPDGSEIWDNINPEPDENDGYHVISVGQFFLSGPTIYITGSWNTATISFYFIYQKVL